ncbi:MAG: hypothetical protein A2Z20_01095 [Bdellovibrionales bacterium RBG_16_40_8]|nr:MAG: hypothetical protein A2Z20_01095 [Bdellovibrionales bacterium RBG_16_40_8]
MSNLSKSGSFFDNRLILVLAIVITGWIAWQAHLAKKYPEFYKRAQNNKQQEAPVNKEISPNSTTKAPVEAPVTNAENKKIFTETMISYDDDIWSFKVSSQGMALKEVRLKKFLDRVNTPIEFAKTPETSLFGTGLLGQRNPVDFSVQKTNDHEIVGVAQLGEMKITKILQIDSQNYSISTKVRVENATNAFTGLVTNFSEVLDQNQGGSFFSAHFGHQEFYANHDGTGSRFIVDAEKPKIETYAQTKIASFGSQYFATAVVDRSPIMPSFKAMTIIDSKPLGIGSLTYSVLNTSNKFAIEYVVFAGPKTFEVLKAIDADLTNLVDFGFFTTIAKGILWLMKTIHSAIGNWGIAIIFLTLIVRIIVLPFNLLGYKQMKAMAKIQPQIKLLRERFKDDQQKLSQEMMQLMKEAKANPLGGCLPMLFQIPIFFALYQVIGQSIELYQAPFALWINDLSLKDPFYVLPALMGITMFIQQKISPSTLDPAQQKIMTFMPLLFTFFMISLPSGLTLYIFVSSVFGVLQQIYFMKDNNPVVAKA